MSNCHQENWSDVVNQELDSLRVRGVELLDAIVQMRSVIGFYIGFMIFAVFIANDGFFKVVRWFDSEFFIYYTDEKIFIIYQCTHLIHILLLLAGGVFCIKKLYRIPRILGKSAIGVIFSASYFCRKSKNEYPRWLFDFPVMPRGTLFDLCSGVLYGLPAHQALNISMQVSKYTGADSGVVVSNGDLLGFWKNDALKCCRKIRR